jgi:hypothetical protein
MSLKIYPVVLELVRRCAPVLLVLRKRSREPYQRQNQAPDQT